MSETTKLADYSDDDLKKEVERRRSVKLENFRSENRKRNAQLTREIVDVIAPTHKSKSRCVADPTSVVETGYAECLRCTLEEMLNWPQGFDDVRMTFSVDFCTSKQYNLISNMEKRG